MNYRGFSLVELLVALAVGMFVVLGITQVFTATYRANTGTLQLTNINSNLRSTLNVMSREMRRSGYWYGAVLDVKNGTSANPFFVTGIDDRLDSADFSAGTDGTNDCFLFGYDADGDGTSDANEWRGFRLAQDADSGNGVVEAKLGDTGGTPSDFTAANNCGDATANGGWQQLTDPNVVNISDLSFAYENSAAESSVPVQSDCPDADTFSRVFVRTLTVGLTGNLVSDPTIARTANTLIRLRNDLIETDVAHNPSECTVTP